MNALEIVTLLIPFISKKVRSAGNKVMAEINNRGALTSTITQESCIEAYAVAFEEELNFIYKKIPKIKFKMNEIKKATGEAC